MNKILLKFTLIIMVPLVFADSKETDKIKGSGISIIETRIDSNFLALDITIAYDQIIVHCGSSNYMIIKFIPRLII